MKLLTHKKYLLLPLIMFLCVIIASLTEAEGSEETAPTAPIRVKTYRINSENELEETYSGEIRSREETQLSFLVSGKIISCPVKAGDRVKAGDTIAVIDDRTLRQGTASAKARHDTALSQLNLARKNLARYQALLGEGAVSQADFDNINQAYEAAAAAERESRAQLSESSIELGYSRLTADRDGIVTEVKVTAGQTVNAGEIVAAIADENALELKFAVPEKSVSELNLGQNIAVTLTGKNSPKYTASIREISPMADADTRTFTVKAALPQASNLRIGMTAKASIINDAAKSIYVPRSAISDNNGTSVFVIENGTAKLRPVKTGAIKGDEVEILSGLAKDEVIIAAGLNTIYDGASVEEITN